MCVPLWLNGDTFYFFKVCFLVSGTAGRHELQHLSAPETLVSRPVSWSGLWDLLVSFHFILGLLWFLLTSLHSGGQKMLRAVLKKRWRQVVPVTLEESEESRGSITGCRSKLLTSDTPEDGGAERSLQMFEECWQSSSNNILSYSNVSDGSEH